DWREQMERSGQREVIRIAVERQIVDGNGVAIGLRGAERGVRRVIRRNCSDGNEYADREENRFHGMSFRAEWRRKRLPRDEDDRNAGVTPAFLQMTLKSSEGYKKGLRTFAAVPTIPVDMINERIIDPAKVTKQPLL